MIGFLDFAMMHGLHIKCLYQNRICRVPTVEKPNSNNGAYFYAGDFGWVQDWYKSDKPDLWFSDGKTKEVPKMARDAYFMERDRLARKAAAKAKAILSESELAKNYYLERKGFGDMLALVHERRLVVPMYINGEISGIQKIADWGEKKFLYGQRNKAAHFRIGKGRQNILCEGYATGLSIHNCIPSSSVWVCFSAGNIPNVARVVHAPAVVVADNDKSGAGELYAKKTGLRYLMPPTVGMDFNDWWRVDRLRAQSALVKFINAV